MSELSSVSPVKSVVMQVVRFVGCLGILAGIVAVFWAVGGYRLKLSPPQASGQSASDSSQGGLDGDVAAASSMDNSAGSSLDE